MDLALDFQGLIEHLKTARSNIARLDEEQVNSLAGGEVLFKYGDINLPFTTEDFFLTYALPSFYFHVSIAFGILRSMGVHTEVNGVLEQLQGKHRLMVEILYGSGLRLNELLSLRIKDLDFALSTITVRSGKGDKDRVTLLPQSLINPLQVQVKSTALLHQQDLRDGYGEVYMPYALARKYPRAASELGWQFLFPATSIGRDPRSAELRCHHLHNTTLRKSIGRARREANITKPVR